jgi:hypothetical protein
MMCTPESDVIIWLSSPIFSANLQTNGRNCIMDTHRHLRRTASALAVRGIFKRLLHGASGERAQVSALARAEADTRATNTSTITTAHHREQYNNFDGEWNPGERLL